MDVLHTVVTEWSFTQSARKDEQMQSILEFVTNESTSSYCDNCLAILGPIDKYLTLFQCKTLKADSFRKQNSSF
jgi:hypothetical protein